jgi:hypothetical protein
MNKDRTCSPSDAELTQARSPDVPFDPGWGYTYFVRNGEAIKIGHTALPKARMMDLQIASPEPLNILAIVSNTIIKEADAHRKFAHLRIRGEWFRAESELLEFIATVKGAPVPPLPERSLPEVVAPELKAIRKQLAKQRPHLPEKAQNHASNLIEQIDNIHTEADFVRLKPRIARAQRALAAAML